jgi:hypothetical protein
MYFINNILMYNNMDKEGDIMLSLLNELGSNKYEQVYNYLNK